jgi:hypothetical protein
MKIEKLKLIALRNEEHFQLANELDQLIKVETPQKLQIEIDYGIFKVHLADESLAIQVIQKSATSDLIADKDIERDNIYRGLADAVKSYLNHFAEDKQTAAKRLAILLDQYGNLTMKPYNEETAAIHKLAEEARTAYKDDFALLNLHDWIDELEIKNLDFERLMKKRYSEEADKTDLRMKNVRMHVDISIRKIIDRINAILLINGPTGYENFVNEVNARFSKYQLILAQRQGRAAKSKLEEITK